VTSPGEARAARRGGYLYTLALAALGVVYGDIGTSPLYAIRYSFYGTHGIAVTPGNVLGVLSLVFWALVIVVTIKYHIVIIRADNKGEGGVLALMALVNGSRVARGLSPRRVMIVLGIFGSALLYADGGLTPAISVLSAVEGLEIATPALASWVIPVTLVILIGLFLVQTRGTARIGAVFGPVMLVWFVTIGVLGLSQIIRQPGVLAAVSPYHAARFFAEDPRRGFVVLGAVFLVVTGGEALYADLGHFGHRAIQLAWFGVALPCLLLNYFGQGALLLHDAAAAANPFYHLAPAWALYPLIALATAATIIASQAVISGAFSLTRQAVQLGYSPRLQIAHTSSREIGQIYVPLVNRGLMLLTCLLVLGFHAADPQQPTSSNIAGAYGVALSTLMLITTLMFYVMSREVWRWSFARAAIVSGLFLCVDVPFFGANMLKISSGGWVPLVIAAAIFLLMTTWPRGREILGKRMEEKTVAPRSGDGGVLVRHDRRHPPGAGAQPDAQQGAARAGRVLDDGDAGRAPRLDRGARNGEGHREGVLPGRREVRVHGRSGHRGRARGLPGKVARHSHRGHDVLPRARDARRLRSAGHAPLARGAVRVHVA